MAIEDWVAERPGLAEQKLKVTYTGREWLMKASEILAHHREKREAVPMRLTANSLAMAWKRLYSERYGGFVKDLTHKEMGQLKQFIQKTGELSPSAMECALNDWPRLAFMVREQKGVKVTPERPVVGFLLQYHDVAVQLIAKDKVRHRIDKVVETQETPVQAEEKATYDDVLEALQNLGTKEPQ